MTELKGVVDTTVAEAYEKHMVPGMFLAWTERVVGLAAPEPGERVLDVACGTGIGARTAASSVGGAKLAGVDIDAGVIEVARRLAQTAGTRIEWHCASALKMPFPDAEFDLCLCLQGLQFFPDRVAALAEIRRVLNPAGRLVASIWGPLEHNKGHHVVVQALERQGVDAAPAKKACSFGNADDIREAASQAAFTRIDLHSEDGVSHFASIQSFIDGMTSGSPSTRHAVAQLSSEGRARFEEEVKASLAPYVAGAELQYPTRTFVLEARP